VRREREEWERTDWREWREVGMGHKETTQKKKRTTLEVVCS